MLNCAHPTHFAGALEADAPWIGRLRGIRANASRLSHAELDEAETLDEGDPAELAAAYRELSERLPRLSVVRRLLWHRPPPRRGDRRRRHSVTTYSNDAQASSAKIAS